MKFEVEIEENDLIEFTKLLADCSDQDAELTPVSQFKEFFYLSTHLGDIDLRETVKIKQH